MSMTENLLLEGWEDEEYKAFVDKFKAKKTTDDCYTPPEIYDVIADWVAGTYHRDKGGFLRPFYPGGDYERFEYPPLSTVVDNPPFSILSQIVRFYAQRRIPFFLLAPTLTLFSAAANETCSMIPVGVSVTYANGAEVNTSFLTNLEPADVRVRTAPDLYRLVDAKNRTLIRETRKELPKYNYPDSILTAAIASRWCKYGVDYVLRKADSLRITGLEAQKATGKEIFGGGYLLSTRAAAERAAAERAAATTWELSDTERFYIDWLDKQAQP